VTELPASPYKGLAAFDDSELDALFFFGREHEREAIVANLLANRLTVLYGPSGVGKSSLLCAGVARQLRRLGGHAVVLHDAWAEDPVAGLIDSLSTASPGLGPTAGLVDALAAAGGAYLLLDQFEEYFVYHGADGPLSSLLPELLRRPGLRTNVLIALRDDALSELDSFPPGFFANLLRLERLDRPAARSAIIGPLQRYSELAGTSYSAEPELVESLLDEVTVGTIGGNGSADAVPAGEGVEAPYLQLVLERMWEAEAAAGSYQLRLGTLQELGGAEQIVREHVQGALERLPAAEQDAAARVLRQLVTSSGAKVSHTEADLADYAGVQAPALRPLLGTLGRERIVRGVDGAVGGPARYEIFHDVLARPLLEWRAGYELVRAQAEAQRHRRNLRVVIVASVAAVAIVAAIAVFALLQRSSANTQARRAHGRELAAQALAAVATNPVGSLRLALRAAQLAPEHQSEEVLRTSLLAIRELRVVGSGRGSLTASFAPVGERLLAAGSDGAVRIYDGGGHRLLSLPRQHGATHAAWSADAQTIATGDAAGNVTLWRADDGRAFRSLQTRAAVVSLAFVGNELAIGTGGRVWILDRSAGKLHRFRVGGAVVSVALSPGGNLLAVAAKHRGTITTRILDARTGRTRARLPERGINSVGFSADGRLLVTGSTDKTARLWLASSGRMLHVLPHSGHVVAERFSPDGHELVTASGDGTAAVWNVQSGQRRLLLVGATGAAEDAAFSPDAKEIVVAFADRIARIYDSGDGRLLAPLAGHGEAVTSVGFDPRGRTIVTSSDDGTARLWSANAGDQLAPLDRRADSVTALFAGDRILTVAGPEARLVTTAGLRLRRFTALSPIVAAATTPTSVALADSKGDLELVSLPKSTRTLRGLGISALAYAPDGTLVTGSRDGTLRIWRGGAPVLVRGPQSIAQIAAARTRILTQLAGGTVRIYGFDGRLLHAFDAHAQRASLAPDGTVFATARGRNAALWDVATGKLRRQLTGHRSLVTDVEFSPDSSMLVTASADHDARVWDVGSGDLLHVLRGHFFAVRTASFSPDGNWIVTSSQFTAGLWKAHTGELVLYLRGHAKPLTGAVFDASGHWIATGSQDGTARVVACAICGNLPELEQVARERLRELR
jgi:WD40 repeat protein